MTRPKGKMPLKNFKRIIDELGDYAYNVILSGYGEPFLSEDVFDMIRYAKEKKIRVETNTNGHFFNSSESLRRLIMSGLDSMTISLDGASQEIYSSYRRGGDFRRVVDGIRHIIKERRRLHYSTPSIVVQFIVTKHNEQEISDIKELAKELEVDRLIFKPVSIADFKNGGIDLLPPKLAKEYLPLDRRFHRYELSKDHLHRKVKVRNECGWLWNRTAIYHDGTVSPCCFDVLGVLSMGNMFMEGSFARIWNGKKYRALRKQISRDKTKLLFCSNCPAEGATFEIKAEDI